MPTKRCSTCKKDLPTDHYTKRPSSKDGLRAQCKTCVNNARKARVPSENTGRRGGMKLDSQPFREWLLKRESIWGGRAELAQQIGLSEREIYAYATGERKRVSLGTVDHALVHEASTMLWEIYPELYE